MQKQQEEYNASRSKLFLPTVSAELKFLSDTADEDVRALY
jgi:hypothetical protein